MARLKYLICFIFLFTLHVSHAQETETDSSNHNYSTKKPYHIILKDGSSYTGFILKDDARELLLKTTSVGEIYIPKVSIRSIEEVDDIGKLKKGEYFGDEIYYTRYLLSPNALSLKKGENNVYMPYLTYGHAQFGVTDNFDAGIGTSWLGNPLTASLKYTFDLSNTLKFAVGGIGITSTYGSLYFGGGAGYAVLTKGTPSKNISIGAGYAAMFVDGISSKGYAVTAGAYKRLNPRWSILFDGFYIPEFSTYFAGPGFRYFRKRKEGEMIDFGILLIGSDLNNNGRPISALPVLSYIVIM